MHDRLIDRIRLSGVDYVIDPHATGTFTTDRVRHTRLTVGAEVLAEIKAGLVEALCGALVVRLFGEQVP